MDVVRDMCMEVGDIIYNDKAVYPHDILTYMDGNIVVKKGHVGRFVFLYQDFLDFEWSAVPMFRNLSWG
jgi:hypothetical protein